MAKVTAWRNYKAKHYADYKEGLPQGYQRKQRKCLRCSKLFLSSWCGERICSRCETLNNMRADYHAQKVTFR